MRRWENLTAEEQKEICDEINLRNILKEIADLNYQAYFLKISKDELYDKLMEKKCQI